MRAGVIGSPLLLSSSIFLAGVLAVAAVAKLLDRTGSARAAQSFGVPARLIPIVSIGLPIAEAIAAAMLLFSGTRPQGAVAALLLLLLFCVAIGYAMARGKAPDCHCFGQLHSAPAGWRTLARNLVLAGLAAFVVVAGRDDPGPGAFAWTGRLDSAQWLVVTLGFLLVATVAVGGYAVVHVLRSYGRVLVRLERVEGQLRAAGFDLAEPDDVPRLGLEPGTPAPAFWLPSVEGRRVSLGDLLERGRPVLLLFTSPTCGPCTHLMPTVAAWQADHRDALTVAVISSGDADEVRAEAAAHGLDDVLLDATLSTYEAYEANGTPSAVLVSSGGTIATWLAAGTEWIESLVADALGGLGRAPGLPVGSDLPATQVQLLDGDEVELGDVVERETVLLFWNPGCGYCRSIHEAVREWEGSALEAGSRTLVVVSSGTVEEIRAERFLSPVVLDPEWRLASSLGADGTPMALVIGVDQRIASPLVTGGDAILDLLHAEVPAAV